MAVSPNYDALANNLTVESIMDRLGRDVQATENAYTLRQELRSLAGQDQLAATTSHLVRDDGRVMGICSYGDLFDSPFDLDLFFNDRDDGRVVRDFARAIIPSRMISINTKFSRAVGLFEENDPPYCVLDGDQIVGVFQGQHLYRPRALLCYLALTLDLETAALDLCTWYDTDCWSKLSEKRQSEARRIYFDKFRKVREETWSEILDDGDDVSEYRNLLLRDILQCTTFIDKSTMLQKARLLKDQNTKRVKDIVVRAERIRNACAHPVATDRGHPERCRTDTHDLFGLTWCEMSRFVNECIDVLGSIEAATRDAAASAPER